MNARSFKASGIVLLGLVGWQPAAAATRWEYNDQTLDNGLRVVVMEDHSAPAPEKSEA